MEMENKKQKNVFGLILLSTLYFLLSAPFANAATLHFSPSSGSYAVGDTLSANVYVSSADQALNAASGVISFPQDKLEVVSLSKNGSIFSLWVQEPSFSNNAGTINFEGIVLNPGFTGSAGKIITANFRVKNIGSAQLSFSSGSVLANDGKGTNILTNMGNASFNLSVAPVVSQAPPTTITHSVVFGAPSAPQISSSTHPDQNKWYNNNNPEFKWELESDASAIRLLYDKETDSKPQIVYLPPISEKKLENLADGVYYFHAQFKNKNGWGDIAHFRFQIDTKPPEPFSVKFLEEMETANSRPTALFNTDDSVSGVDYYRIKIGDGDFFDLPAVIVKSNPYTLPPQGPGKKTIIVQAFDKAGNFSVSAAEFTILPTPQQSWLSKACSEAVKILAVLTPLLALVILFISIFWFGWHKLSLLRKKVRKETSEAEIALHKAFNLLREEIRRQIKMLEKTRMKRKLTNEEEKIIEELNENLDDAEKFIRKEIEDIEKTAK